MAVPQEPHLTIADALLDVDSQMILPVEPGASSSSMDNQGKKRRIIETLSMMTRAAESGNLTSISDVQQMFSATLQALEATSVQQAATADSLASKFLRAQTLPKSIQKSVLADVKILKDRLLALIALADKEERLANTLKTIREEGRWPATAKKFTLLPFYEEYKDQVVDSMEIITIDIRGCTIGEAKEKLFKEYEQHLMALDLHTTALRAKNLRKVVTEKAFIDKVSKYAEEEGKSTKSLSDRIGILCPDDKAVEANKSLSREKALLLFKSTFKEVSQSYEADLQYKQKQIDSAAEKLDRLKTATLAEKFSRAVTAEVSLAIKDKGKGKGKGKSSTLGKGVDFGIDYSSAVLHDLDTMADVQDPETFISKNYWAPRQTSSKAAKAKAKPKAKVHAGSHYGTVLEQKAQKGNGKDTDKGTGKGKDKGKGKKGKKAEKGKAEKGKGGKGGKSGKGKGGKYQ